MSSYLILFAWGVLVALEVAPTARPAYALSSVSRDCSDSEAWVVAPRRSKASRPVRAALSSRRGLTPDGPKTCESLVSSPVPVCVAGKLRWSAPFAPAELKFFKGGFRKLDTPTWLSAERTLFVADLEVKKLQRLDPVGDATTEPGPEAARGHVGKAMTLRGHVRTVTCVAFSPDGKTIFSGGSDDTLRVWDATTGKAIRTLRGGGKGVTCLAVRADGLRLAAGHWDGTLKIWDTLNGRELQTRRGHAENLTAIAYRPDGKRVVSGSGDDTLKVWDEDTGKALWSLDHGNEYDITAVAYSPNGKQIASGDGENTLILWDADRGEEPLTLSGHTGALTCVVFSPDGKRLVSASADDSLKLWDAENGRELMTLRGHTDDVTTVAFRPDGRRLASGSADGTVRLWNAQTGREVATLRGPAGEVAAVAFSPDGRRLVAAIGAVLHVWELSK
jgi:WD40 repeat protein